MDDCGAPEINPETALSPMSKICRGDDGPAVATSWEQALKERADVTVSIGVKVSRTGGGFHKARAPDSG
jgi:hypothetical protein